MKKLTIGIIIGLMLGISTNAFAAIGDTVQAVFSQYVYEVNGETKTAETPVLVYEGVSYLRTTDIGNMLGYDVTYRADSRTIAFDNGGTPTPSDPVPVEPVVDPIEPVPTEPIIDPVTGEVVPPVEGQPTTEETPPVVVEPEPDNTATCQGIRDDYAGQIAMLAYGAQNDIGHVRQYTRELEYERDRALSDAGC